MMPTIYLQEKTDLIARIWGRLDRANQTGSIRFDKPGNLDELAELRRAASAIVHEIDTWVGE